VLDRQPFATEVINGYVSQHARVFYWVFFPREPTVAKRKARHARVLQESRSGFKVVHTPYDVGWHGEHRYVTDDRHGKRAECICDDTKPGAVDNWLVTTPQQFATDIQRVRARAAPEGQRVVGY
jgi:hypothetical protein